VKIDYQSMNNPKGVIDIQVNDIAK